MIKIFAAFIMISVCGAVYGQPPEVYGPCYEKEPGRENVYRTLSPGLPGTSFNPRKRYDEKRVMIIGGSAAHYYLLRAGDSLKKRLNEALPSVNVEIIHCAYPERDSAGDVKALEESLEFSPDILLVVSGADDLRDPLFSPEARKAVRDARLSGFDAGMMRNLLTEIRKKSGPVSGAEEASRRFSGNLGRMLLSAREKGAVLVAATVPANIRNFPPAGALPFGEKNFFKAWTYWVDKKPVQARQYMQDYVKARPYDPMGYYVFGEMIDSWGEESLAREYYLKAADLDPSPRPSNAMNEAVRKFCETREVPLLDLDRAFSSVSENGMSGRELFLDGGHWKTRYNDFVTASILRFFMERDTQKPSSFLAEPSGWKTAWINQAFENYSRRGQAEDSDGDALESFVYGASRAAWDYPFVSEKAIACFESAFKSSPGIFKKAGKLKVDAKSLAPKLSGLWTDYGEISKRWAGVLFNAGESFRRKGMEKEALYYFGEALNEDPSLELARLYRAVIFKRQGRREDADKEIELLSPGIKRSPDARLLRD